MPTVQLLNRFFKSTGLLVLVIALSGCGGFYGARPGGDFYTSDLIDTRIVIGPVGEARVPNRGAQENREIALTQQEIQIELSEGISEIHRGATIQRIEGTGGPEKALGTARAQGAELLIVPRIEQLTIDDVGRNGLESVAIATDVLLFPVTLGVALVTQGERSGVGHQYIPIHDVRITNKMTLDYYRVSDGSLLTRKTYPTYVDAKVNKDNLEGPRLDSTDDMREIGKEHGRFSVRELGRRIAKEEIPELTGVQPANL